MANGCKATLLIVTSCLMMLASFERSRAATQSTVAAVHAQFDLTTPGGGPFPSDWFTVSDATQNTSRRVSLPLGDCTVRVSDCEDLRVLNTLDGFNLQPRLSIPFDGLIDVKSVTSETVFLISLGSTLGETPESHVVGINQVIWNPATNTLHAKSDELLDQHTRYGLIVTDGVRDLTGQPIKASETFPRFGPTSKGAEYYGAVGRAIQAAGRLGIGDAHVVAASVFTTQSATAVLEKIRNQIKAATPLPADFLLGPDRTRTVFRLDEVSGIISRRQNRVDPPGFLPDVSLTLSLLRDISPGAVGRIAFGKYVSPDYMVHPGEFIPPVATRTGVPVARATNDVYFNLVLPSGQTPVGGWPIAILGHGSGGSKNDHQLSVAATLAEHGIATIEINAVGRGFGSLSTLTVSRTGGPPLAFSAGGRSIDQNNDGVIEFSEGGQASKPRSIILERDGILQTVVDLMQLVRVIEMGVDVDGDFVADVNPSRIYYLGFSFGAGYGTPFLAVDRRIRAGALHSVGQSVIQNRRLAVTGNRDFVGQALSARVPSLINSPGIAILGGSPVSTPGLRFNENVPLRQPTAFTVRLEDGLSYGIQSPLTDTVRGAAEIQEVLENAEWVAQSSSSMAYAPYLRRKPLLDVPPKPVIVLFGKGDKTIANANETAVLRAGGLADRATFYRNDLAFAENPNVPKDPHGFVNPIGSTIPLVSDIARGAQRQIAIFFSTDGGLVIQPEPSRFFEVPIRLPLPEDLSYIP